MPVSRPSSGFPDFATDDYNNGAGGAPNVQEPSSGKKQSGWDFGEKPQREFFNWIHRTTNNWLKYADDQVTNIIPALITALTSRVSALETKTDDADSYFKNQM